MKNNSECCIFSWSKHHPRIMLFLNSTLKDYADKYDTLCKKQIGVGAVVI